MNIAEKDCACGESTCGGVAGTFDRHTEDCETGMALRKSSPQTAT